MPNPTWIQAKEQAEMKRWRGEPPRKYWLALDSVISFQYGGTTDWQGYVRAIDKLGRTYDATWVWIDHAPDRLGAILALHKQAEKWVNEKPWCRQLLPIGKTA